MKLPIPIQTGHKVYNPDEFEECKEECMYCKWNKMEKDTQGVLWAICTSPDGYFERKED